MSVLYANGTEIALSFFVRRASCQILVKYWVLNTGKLLPGLAQCGYRVTDHPEITSAVYLGLVKQQIKQNNYENSYPDPDS